MNLKKFLSDSYWVRFEHIVKHKRAIEEEVYIFESHLPLANNLWCVLLAMLCVKTAPNMFVAVPTVATSP